MWLNINLGGVSLKIVIPRIIHNKEQLTWDWSGTITNIKKNLGKYEIVEE